MEENVTFATEQICSDCGEEIALLDEVVLVQILYQAIDENGEQYFTFEEAGDFVYAPHYFCVECWEETKGTLEDILADCPPTGDDHATRKCNMCRSGIRNMELVVVITLGELRRSQRMPDGQPTVHFAGIQRPEVWCMPCGAHLNDDVINLWEDGITFDVDDDAEEPTEVEEPVYACRTG